MTFQAGGAIVVWTIDTCFTFLVRFSVAFLDNCKGIIVWYVKFIYSNFAKYFITGYSTWSTILDPGGDETMSTSTSTIKTTTTTTTTASASKNK